MTTLHKVAEKAGVSIATVSKVLSNTPYFSDATRDKVLQAVEEVGYIPNLAARALSKGKTHIIAVVFPLIFDTIFTDPLVQHLLEGVEAACNQEGYNLLLSTPRIGGKRIDENYLQLVQSGYLDGVVALDNIPGTKVLDPVRAKDIPAVAIGYNEHTYSVRSDDQHGGNLLMSHVLELGHRHIGIIAVSPNLNFSIDHRLQGLQISSTAYGLAYESLPRAEGNFSVASGYECAQQLLAAHPQLTALVCLNDRMAMGAMHFAQQHGYRIPDDLTIVGYDDITLAKMSTPPLTTINQQAPQLGRLATRMLFDVIHHRQPDSVTVPTQLIVRASSASPRGSARLS